VRPDLLPVVPDTPRLAFQAVHSRDVGEAYARAALDPAASGAFNIAAEPVLDSATLARVLGARRVPVPAAALRAAAAASWALRVTPASPDWLDLGLGVPLMDVTRAREVLGWTPGHSAADALLELLGGLRDSAGLSTPPLDPATSGPLRLREVLTGIGRREP
jgi:nucleoside-diphosphate-sugar epimerase